MAAPSKPTRPKPGGGPEIVVTNGGSTKFENISSFKPGIDPWRQYTGGKGTKKPNGEC